MTVAEVKSLGLLLQRPPRYGVNAAAVPLAPGVPTYIRITDIDDYGRFAPDPKVGVAHPRASNYRMSVGELVFARTGASVGKSYLYDPRDGELVYAGFLINVAPDPKLLNPKYLSLVADTKDYWDWIARTSVRSGQPGVNGREYAQLPVPLPDIAVQNAIADVVTEVDDLIAALERMILKKQAIERGMMQQLLTGRTRLPGCNEPWESTTWGEVAEVISSGATPRRSRPEFWNGEIPWVTSTELKRKVIRDVPQTITTAGLKAGNLTVWPPGTFLMAITGLEAAGTRGSCGLLGIPAATNQSCMAVTPNGRLVSEFLFHYYLLWGDELAFRYTQGTKQQSYTASIVRTLPIRLPTSVVEQRRIASVLADAAKEVGFLRQRLTKAREVKQGMMQDLLTGRTRLPVEATAA